MNPFRSVGALLSIALSVVLVGALLIVYFMVVPSLQHRLITTKLSQLREEVPMLQRRFDGRVHDQTNPLQDFVDSVVSEIDADRAVTINWPQPDFPLVSADSKQNARDDLSDDPTALEAYRTSSVSQGSWCMPASGTRKWPSLARRPPRSFSSFRTTSSRSTRPIHVVKRRLLIAGPVGAPGRARRRIRRHLGVRAQDQAARAGCRPHLVGSLRRARCRRQPRRAGRAGARVRPHAPAPCAARRRAPASSSPTRRTSCGRRSSPSEASSS